MLKVSLKTEYPEVALLWHPTLNGELRPEDVAPHSNKKAWWICEEKHAYPRTIDQQVTREISCPVCNGKRYVRGINDVRTKYPQIAEEWDYSVNGDKNPEDFSFLSAERVGWKCKECGHTWTVPIKNRCVYGNGCKVCATKRRWESRYSNMQLGITIPELLEEWDYELNEKGPECYSDHSNATVYWHCKKCGYKYQAKIYNKANGRKCACCQRKVVVPGINDLATTHPDIAKEWYQPLNGDTTPSDVMSGSGKKFYWICPRGHIYPATIGHRTSVNGTGCPECNSGRQTSFAEQALFYYVKQVFPNAINGYKDIFSKSMELDVFIPDIQVGIEYDGVYWHHKKPATYERERRKYCICKEHGITLLRVREERIDENEAPPADWCCFLPPDRPSNEALNCGIETVLQKIGEITHQDIGAEISALGIDCSKDRFEILAYLKGPVKNSVQEVAPELVKEWDYEKNGTLKPDMIAAGSSQSVYWRCTKCGYSWDTPIYNRARSHTGCPKCAGFVFEKGLNDLETKRPDLLVDWDYESNSVDGIVPSEIMFNSSRRVKWICHTCGHRWTAPIRNRSVDGNGCIQCGYKAGKEEKRKRIIEKQGCVSDPLLLKEWDFERNDELGLHPSELPPGSNKSVYWICSKCGHRWKAPIARRNKGAGCRKCADKANPDLKRKSLIAQGRALTDELLIKEWDYELNSKMPQDYTFGSKVKVHWICSKCGHKWPASINSRSKGAGCPACAGNIVVTGRNDLATLHPELLKEWDYEKNTDIGPDKVAGSSHQKFWWICPKGHDSYPASVSHRINGTGCPICGNLRIAEKSSRPVDQLSLDGEYIKTFKSVKAASEEMGLSKGAISNAIRKNATSGGFRWRHHSGKE